MAVSLRSSIAKCRSHLNAALYIWSNMKLKQLENMLYKATKSIIVRLSSEFP
ncbi:hypothetical protein THOD04_330002 [Vibrio owensii]|nr:hypothetical protein THOD04_330002 [Vibrio owensii]